MQVLQDREGGEKSSSGAKPDNRSTANTTTATMTATINTPAATVTATTCSTPNSTSSNAQAEMSDSHSRVEPRQNNDGATTVVACSDYPYSKVNSPDSKSSGPDSTLSSPSSSPNTRHKSDTTLSRYTSA